MSGCRGARFSEETYGGCRCGGCVPGKGRRYGATLPVFSFMPDLACCEAAFPRAMSHGIYAGKKRLVKPIIETFCLYRSPSCSMARLKRGSHPSGRTKLGPQTFDESCRRGIRSSRLQSQLYRAGARRFYIGGANPVSYPSVRGGPGTWHVAAP